MFRTDKSILLALIILMLCMAIPYLNSDAHAAGFIEVPGLQFIIDRAKNHGYAGQAWDLKARPNQTVLLTMNNKGPVYIAIGGYWDAINNDPYGLGGPQFDLFHLWRSARNWPLIEKMELVKLPEDWRLLAGPLANLFRVRPDKIRIDRELLFNLAIHIPLGMAGKDKKEND